MRLTEAARCLAETDEPIVEIAYEAHYSSQQAFTTAFRQHPAAVPGARHLLSGAAQSRPEQPGSEVCGMSAREAKEYGLIDEVLSDRHRQGGKEDGV